MANSPSIEAWNNFVMCSQPSDYQAGSNKRSAAIASLYMGLANNGGINSFLTCSYELDAAEALEALVSVGAFKAAQELSLVLRGLGAPVPSSSQEARFRLLEQHWSDTLDEHDYLSADANEELLRALQRHVQQHEAFYIALK
jgi:hypothetical protein